MSICYLRVKPSHAIFTESANCSDWANSVIELLCPSVCLCFCTTGCSFFLGLTLTLRSHDQFQASHWSSLPPPPLKKNWNKFYLPRPPFFGPPVNKNCFDRQMMKWWSYGIMEWRNDRMVEWWNDGVMEWWNDGMMEWYNDRMLEWWNDRMME